MKRFLKIFTAAAMGLALTSCFQDDSDLVTFVPDNVTAPTWTTTLEETYTLTEDKKDEEFAVFSYTAADFGMKTGISYELYMALKTDEAFANAKKLGSATELEIKITNDKINTQVRLLTDNSTDPTEVVFKVVAQMMGKSAATGISAQTATTIGTTVTAFAPAVTEHPKVYVIGAFNGWDHAKDLNLYSYSDDGNLYEGVVDFDYYGKIADHTQGFKLTGVPNWNDDAQNWGAASDEGQPSEPTDAVTLISGGSSKNITSFGTFRYYKFQFTREPLAIKKIYGFNSIGIIGNGGDWDNDIVMTFNPVYERFYVDVENLSGSIKFRSDAGWDGVNLGGTTSKLTQSSNDNVAVETAGSYRVYLYMNDSNNMYCVFDSEMYGKDEPTTKGEPEPEPEPEVWSIVGSLNNWGSGTDGAFSDLDMTEISTGVWERRKVALSADDEFKLRFQHDWAMGEAAGPEENAQSSIDATNPYPVFQPTIGTAFTALAENGKNIKVGVAGTYDITYDTAAKTILIEEYDAVWSVIGMVNGTEWSTDYFMTNDGTGIWKSDRITINGAFKVRYDCDWVDNRGAEGEIEPVEIAIGTATAVVAGGKNFTLAEANLNKDYYVTYNANDNTVTVEAALPQNQWSLIGNVGDDTTWTVDFYMHPLASGLWISDPIAITGGFKIRYNNQWDPIAGSDAGGANRGGTFVTDGVPFAVTAGGADITVPNTAGKYQVVYNPMMETITVREINETTWGLVGNIEYDNWASNFLMTEVAAGIWKSENLKILSGKEVDSGWGFKLRRGVDWTNWDNQAGQADEAAVVELGTPLATVTGSDAKNVYPTVSGNVYQIVYNTNDATVTVNGTWAMIGNIEGDEWSKDFYLTETSAGVWERKALQVDAKFKLRFNSSWGDADCRGAAEDNFTLTSGTEITVTNPGKDIAVPAAGKYNIKWIPADNKLTVTAYTAE